jgi:hypothetical protein
MLDLYQAGQTVKAKADQNQAENWSEGRTHQQNLRSNLFPLSSPTTMLPSHLNGHSPLARRPRLSAATGDPPAAEAAAGDAALAAHDRVYFQSYSHIGIHEAMIKVSHHARARARARFSRPASPVETLNP